MMPSTATLSRVGSTMIGPVACEDRPSRTRLRRTYARERADDAHLGQTAVGIRITRPGPAAESLVAALAAIVDIERSHDADLTIVHFNQTDATTGAAPIRQLAAQRDPDWGRS
jgi:hypothetical protein